MWKVSVCVHDGGGTPKNTACRTRHGAGVRGSAQRPQVAPHPARGGGPQQPMGAAPACPPAPGRTGVAAGGRRAASRAHGQPPGAGLGRRPEARGTAGYGEALAGMPRAMGLYISYTPCPHGSHDWRRARPVGAGHHL
jgi:hypothetical protein